jgi:hypothetical protein
MWWAADRLQMRVLVAASRIWNFSQPVSFTTTLSGKVVTREPNRKKKFASLSRILYIYIAFLSRSYVNIYPLIKLDSVILWIVFIRNPLYIYIYTYIHTNTHTHTYIHTHTHVCVWVCVCYFNLYGDYVTIVTCVEYYSKVSKLLPFNAAPYPKRRFLFL